MQNSCTSNLFAYNKQLKLKRFIVRITTLCQTYYKNWLRLELYKLAIKNAIVINLAL